MPQLFKFAGLFILFITCALAGIFKSFSLKKRAASLCSLVNSLKELSSRIGADAGELASLVEICFDSSLVRIEDGQPSPCRAALQKEELSLLQEFFAGAGMRDAVSEQERTRLFAALLEKRLADAEKKCSELCRLYNTLGFLCGVFLFIFFL